MSDLKKAVRQHLEMDDFFTGGFSVKSQESMQDQTKANEAAEEAAIELEKITDEVRQCRKCGLGSLRTNAVPGGQGECANRFCRRGTRC